MRTTRSCENSVTMNPAKPQGEELQATSSLATEGPFPLALASHASPSNLRGAHPRAGEVPASKPGVATTHIHLEQLSTSCLTHRHFLGHLKATGKPPGAATEEMATRTSSRTSRSPRNIAGCRRRGEPRFRSLRVLVLPEGEPYPLPLDRGAASREVAKHVAAREHHS